MLNAILNIFRMIFLIEEPKLPDPEVSYSAKETIELVEEVELDLPDPMKYPVYDMPYIPRPRPCTDISPK